MNLIWVWVKIMKKKKSVKKRVFIFGWFLIVRVVFGDCVNLWVFWVCVKVRCEGVSEIVLIMENGWH